MSLLSWIKQSLLLRSKKNYLLVAILVVAATLRFIAVKPGYNQYHGDETAIWGSALQMVKKGTLDPGRYDYPETIMLINVFAYKYFFIPLAWLGYYLRHFWDVVDGTLKLVPTKLEANKLFDLYIAGERGVNAIFWSRYVTALFGLGSVFLTYLLSKKMFSAKVGILAALFLTFNYKNVVNSHLALPDIYNAFFLLLSLVASWNLMKKPTWRTYLLAGAAAGIAFSVKYQFFSVIPLVFAHLFVVVNAQGNLVEKIKKLFDVRFITGGLLIPLIFMLTNPYFFINIETVIIKMNEEFRKYGFGTNSLNLFPLSYLYHIDYGPVESLLVLLGVFIGLMKKTSKSIFLLLIIAPILFTFLYYTRGGFYVRNFILVTPLLLIFAALFAWEISNFLLKKFGKLSLIILLPALVATLYVPAKNSILSSYGYTKPWGFETLKPWIQENLPKDVLVAVHPFDKANLGIKNKATEFSHEEAYALREHVDNGDSYVVLNFDWANLPFYFWMNYGPSEAVRLWNKPLDILRNTFHGLAAEEMFRYQVKTVTKPWQSPDHHFVVVKVPSWPEGKMKEIKKFSFDKDQENWTVLGKWSEGEAARYKFDSGSLMLDPGGVRFPTVRISSEPIVVASGHLYKVSAKLKTEKMLTSKEKAGFLRIDFYPENPDLEKIGMTSAVSSRVFGENDWVKKEIVDRAPEGSKYVVVSFQSSNPVVSKMWFDDVVVEQSVDPVEDITAKAPYTKDPIDLNYLYPNSHGNL